NRMINVLPNVRVVNVTGTVVSSVSFAPPTTPSAPPLISLMPDTLSFEVSIDLLKPIWIDSTKNTRAFSEIEVCVTTGGKVSGTTFNVMMLDNATLSPVSYARVWIVIVVPEVLIAGTSAL